MGTPHRRQAALEALCQTVGGTFDAFLDLRAVACLRECAPGLCALYAPWRAAPLWARITPSLNAFHRFAHALTAPGAAMCEGLYSGMNVDDFYKILNASACRCGNLELIRWIWSTPASKLLSEGPETTFAKLCQRGYLAAAAWLAQERGVDFGDLSRYRLLTAACATGDVTMAEWLVVSGYIPGADEFGYALLTNACRRESIAFADWVLRRFPLCAPSAVLCVLAGACCNSDAPRAVRWLTETFNLEWDRSPGEFAELLRVIDENLAELNTILESHAIRASARVAHGRHHNKLTQLHAWLLAQFGPE
jgi:hypothetical protein